MELRQITAVYYSATGVTDKVVRTDRKSTRLNSSH